MKSASPCPRTAHLFAPLALLACAATLGAQTSVKSGVWTDPTVWDTGVVPANDAVVTIAAPHVVGLGPAGRRSPRTTVDTLTVDGVLTATYPEGNTGEDIRLLAINLTNNGTIRAEDDPLGSGGNIHLSTQFGLVGFPPVWAPIPGAFENDGQILAGDALITRRGGTVRIDWRNGAATNRGLVRGGDGRSGGLASIIATDAHNDGGVIRGGDGDDFFGGAARLKGIGFPFGGDTSAINDANGLVRGGDADDGRGGIAEVSAFTLPPWGATAINEGRILPTDQPGEIRGGSACEGGSVRFFGLDAQNRGRLMAGNPILGNCVPPPRGAWGDPPDGVFEGDTEIEADLVQLVGGTSLTLRNLAPGAITAQQDLELSVAPGGTLDLSDLAPGSVFAANGTTIHADVLLLPAGVPVSALFGGGPVTVLQGRRRTSPQVFGGQRYNVAPGERVRIPLSVANEGNMTEDIEVRVDGPPGWPDLTGPMIWNVTLEPGAAWETELDTTVPLSMPYDAYERLTLLATTKTAGTSPVAVSEDIEFEIDALKCAAESFGKNQPLSMHVEPGAAVTAPFLVVDGATPLSTGLVAVATQGSDGLAWPGLPEVYVDPAFITTWVPVLFDGGGRFQFPVNLQAPSLAGTTFSFQTMEIGPGGFTGSNGLALTFCP